jgi:uncharacterized protein (DUF433 family)
MTIKEIKINLHNLIDDTKNIKLLELFYVLLLNQLESNGEEDFWDSLPEDQKKELKLALERSKSDKNLISNEVVMDRAVKYLSENKSFRKKSNRIINVDKEIMSGTPVFKGTRVPIKNLFDYLEGGDNIETFLIDFPRVKKEQIEKVLKIAEGILIGKQK